MRTTLRDVSLRVLPCSTRIPFRFGVMTLEDVGQLTVRATVDVEGAGAVEGLASELLVPKWFDKRPEVSHRENVVALLDSVAAAVEAMTGRHETVFDTWWHAYRHVVLPVEDRPLRLEAGYGPALVERAMMDAVCRGTGTAFPMALRSNLFGFDASRVHPELAGWSPAVLPPPRTTLAVRHTVGMLDPLEVSDLPPGDGLRDGLPHFLTDVIAAYGVDHFKVKVCGDPTWDASRLLRIGTLLGRTGDVVALTLDGNEQYADLGALVEVLREVSATPAGALLLEKLVAIEQPAPRRIALDPDIIDGITALRRFAPVLIDESDVDAYAFPEAVRWGYEGVSVKGCKGVSRALLNRAYCDVHEKDLFQTGEDLTTLGGFGVQQDLVLMATLGIEHVERNGHHYFRGLDHLPPVEREAVLEAHPDVYERHDDLIHLRIDEGVLRVGSLLESGFGGRAPDAFDARTPVDRWEPLP